MADRIKVVLFEDTKQTQSDLLGALKRHLKDGNVIAFGQHEESPADMERMYEARIESILKKKPYEGATLLLVDRDLSKSQDIGFGGLSDSAVANVAKRLAIPICSYARQPEPEYKWRARWEEGHIVLEFENEEELARRGALAAQGFAEITEKLPEVMKNKSNNSPAKMLAALVAKPEYADKIALYSVGDQSRISEIPAKAKEAGQSEKMMASFLGYWLWDSLLRYPGLLANAVAAASHLNIAPDEFDNHEVQSVFEPALYRGPFADRKRPQWWRGMLDDIVSSENVNDGLELVRKKVRTTIRPCQCSVDPSKTAGYYCIISERPVSLENSKGRLSWFPRGADLTRISKPIFEEYGPWLGA